jgi:hypothetical protein
LIGAPTNEFLQMGRKRKKRRCASSFLKLGISDSEQQPRVLTTTPCHFHVI